MLPAVTLLTMLYIALLPQMLMLTQSDVTARVEMDMRIACLTESQVAMLDQVRCPAAVPCISSLSYHHIAMKLETNCHSRVTRAIKRVAARQRVFSGMHCLP